MPEHENHAEQWSQDPRVKAIAYDDLLAMTKRQKFLDLTLSLPWLCAEWMLMARGHYVFAAGAAFFFFLAGLRQVHQGYHLALGLSKGWTDRFLFIMSILMLGSLHAVKYNHLMHHKHCLDDDDMEARSARMSWLGALAFGPIFPILIHYHALRRGTRYYRRWIVGELAGMTLFVGLAFVICFTWGGAVLLAHLTLMLIGQCMTAFFAVWTVHHGCHDGPVFARTQRGFLKNFVSFDMFYHVEHHLFPRVPQRFLPLIAKRLDEAIPELTRKSVY